MSESRFKHVPGTRSHWILGGAIAITGFIALTRSIDLLWGVAILLVFAAAVATVLPQLQLYRVRVRRLQFPRTAVVGERHRVGYEIDVGSRLPRYDLEIHERLDAGDYSLAAFVPRSQHCQQLFFDWTPRLRGHWRLRALRLECRYPLGLARAHRELLTDEHEVVVYPDCVPLHWLPVHGDAYGNAEQTQARQRGGHGEFFALQPYREGDEARRVHWRASARLGELVTREHERQEGNQLWIVLELSASAHVCPGPEGTCEQMMRIAHSAAAKAHAEGIAVGLLYRIGDAVQRLPASADRSTFQQLRDVLARVQPHAQLPLHGWLQRFADQLPAGGTWLLFNLGGERQRTALQAAVHARSASSLVVELDTASFANGERTAQTSTLRSAQGMVSIVPYGADLTGLFRP